MFSNELESLINRHSMENGSNTPDFLLAGYLQSCLDAFDHAVRERDKWYSVDLAPGRTGGSQTAALNNAMVPCNRWAPGNQCTLGFYRHCDGERCQLSARHQ